MSKVFGVIISVLVIFNGILLTCANAPIFGVGIICCGILMLALIFGGNKI